MAHLISVVEAHGRIQSTAKRRRTAQLALHAAHGHILAQNASAQTTLPPQDASAMDGYAIKRESHHKKGHQFKLIGTSPAGDPFQGEVGANQAVRIYTGGSIPNGANHVIMQENVTANANFMTLNEDLSPSTHIRKSGIDFATNDILVTKGSRLGAYEIGLIAAGNLGQVQVYTAPKVAIIANGDELVAPGTTLKAGQVVSSNPATLAPLLRSWGAETIDMGISIDKPEAIQGQISRALELGADVLVPVGGASVGDRDYMRRVFTNMGYEKVFEKVAVKPGKPVWFGTLDAPNHSYKEKKYNKKNRYVLGLPGNPASALVTAHVFLKPLIDALTGARQKTHMHINAELTHEVKAASWRAEYVRALAKVNGNGTIQVTAIAYQDSSLLTPFLTANCFLVRPPESPPLNKGDIATILPIRPLI